MKSTQEKMPIRNRIFLITLIGLITFIVSMYISNLTGLGPGDLQYSLWPARDWVAGEDPYLSYKISNEYDIVPYPFTTILAALPLVWLPDRVAAGVFSSFGSMLLAWVILNHGKTWQLLTLSSWPFVNSIIFTQWAPYIVSMFFTPNLLPFLLIKPQQALPFVLTQKPKRNAILIAALFLVLSLVLFPSWPMEWWSTLHNYIGYPPLFVLPLGPLLLLALTRYRERRSWLLILMALMPQRMVYDQLGVLLVAEDRNQMLFLVVCSWISFPLLFFYNGWNNIPFGWKQWPLIESYLPALIVILIPMLRIMAAKIPRLLFYKKNQ